MSQAAGPQPPTLAYIVAKNYISAKLFADKKGWDPGSWVLLEGPQQVKGLEAPRVFTIPGAWINPNYNLIMKEVRLRPGHQIVYVEV